MLSSSISSARYGYGYQTIIAGVTGDSGMLGILKHDQISDPKNTTITRNFFPAEVENLVFPQSK